MQYQNNEGQIAPGSSNNIVYGQPVQMGTPVNQYPVVVQGPSTTIIIVESCPTFPGCAICQKQTGSYIIYRNGGMTWGMSAVFCVLTGCCCFIPFMVNRWKDKQFHCNVCNSIKGIQRGHC